MRGAETWLSVWKNVRNRPCLTNLTRNLHCGPQACACATWYFMKVQTTQRRQHSLPFSLPSPLLLAVLATTASLSGCYVVPLDSHAYTHGPTTVVTVPSAPALPVTLSARLYPANEAASPAGVVTANVSNDLNGRGHFSTNILGESFGGEATRVPGSNREGVANGSGNRGSYINCRYTMNSAVMGTGTCSLSTGAIFSMHIGG